MNAPVMWNMDWQLSRNSYGKLVFANQNGETFEGVVPVRAFPISAADHGLALVSSDGRELVWLDTLTALPEAIRELLAEELASREFMPEIRHIR